MAEQALLGFEPEIANTAHKTRDRLCLREHGRLLPVRQYNKTPKRQHFLPGIHGCNLGRT
jgi:hypothetical protein